MVSGSQGGKISSQKNIGLLLYTTVMRQDDGSLEFPHLSSHDLERILDSEDLHSSQLKKIICKEYVNIQLFT